MTGKKINNFRVIPLASVELEDDRPIRSADLLDIAYPIFCTISKKGSGKSTLLSQVVREKTGPQSTIIVFSNNVKSDPVWTSLAEWAKKRGIQYKGYEGIETIKNNEGKGVRINNLKVILDKIAPLYKKENNEDSDEEIETEQNKLDHTRETVFTRVMQNPPDEDEDEEIDPFLSPDWIFVFDDLAFDSKNPHLVKLFNQNRHFRSMICFSSQSPVHLWPQSRTQVNCFMVFRGIGKTWFKKIMEELGLADVDEDDLFTKYLLSTIGKHDNFNIIPSNGSGRREFRKNLNEIVHVKSKIDNYAQLLPRK